MTAAHCYIDEDGKPREPILRTIAVNMYNCSNPIGVTFINLSSGEVGVDIFPHAHYNKTGVMENDIALVILPVGLVEGGSIVYAKLNEDGNVPVDNERLYASGWGAAEFGGDQSDILLGTVVNYVPDDDCADVYGNDFIYDMMMCAFKKGTGTCQGDSGGPLVIASPNETAPAAEPPLQVGITSLAEECVGLRYPIVYTRVSSYVDWIISTACKAAGQLCTLSKAGKLSKAPKNDSKAPKNDRKVVVVVAKEEEEI
jgi:secreted trypsin-like serine protease